MLHIGDICHKSIKKLYVEGLYVEASVIVNTVGIVTDRFLAGESSGKLTHSASGPGGRLVFPKLVGS